MHTEKSISQKVLESWVKFNKSWKEKQTKGIIRERRTLTPNDFHSFSEWKVSGVLAIKACWHIEAGHANQASSIWNGSENVDVPKRGNPCNHFS